jgi:Na+-transporting NADH:ubiquinone oxidoreductase subunit A
MTASVKLKRGFDIRLNGEAEKVISVAGDSLFHAVKPGDFPGLIPRLNVKTGDKVLAGTSLFHDKANPEILYTSPVSGKVIAINRGERRTLLEVIVEKEGDEYLNFGKADPAQSSRELIKKVLMISGLWPVIRQRPYHIVADPADLPKAIFISGFDSSPLAPDYNFIIENSSADLFRTGINALSKLTDGKVNLILRGNDNSSELLKNISTADVAYFSGPHPSGNVGVHIHHLNPINKGEVVWFVNLQDVITIGRLFEKGVYMPDLLVALTGSGVSNPQYFKFRKGAEITGIVQGRIKPGNQRYISGNVLTGTKIGPDGFLGFYDSQISVIPEGNYYEFFGWAKPGLNKFSFYGAFLSKLLPKKKYDLDTNLHGEERAFVITGKYEQVVPMDIFPMQLLKAILAEDIETMENLGIYEVAEEDFALCEVICPSKIEIQSIVRKGINLMIREMS